MATPLGRNLGPGTRYKVNLPKPRKSSIKTSSLPAVHKPVLVAGSFYNAPKQGAGSSSKSPTIFGSSQLGLSGSMNPFAGIKFAAPLTATQQAAKNYNDAHQNHSVGGIMSIIHGGEGLLGKTLDILSRPANAMAAMGSAELKSSGNNFWSFGSPSAAAHGFMQGLEGKTRKNFAQDLEQGHMLNGHSWIRDAVGLSMDIAGDPLNLIGGAGVYAKAGESGFKGFQVFRGLQTVNRADKAREIARLADMGGGTAGRTWLEHTAMIEGKALKDTPILTPEKQAELIADARHNTYLETLAQTSARANMNKYLGLKLGFGKGSITLRTPIKIGKTLAEKRAATGTAFKVKAAIASSLKPAYLDPIGHASAMFVRHTSEDLTHQTWDMAKEAMKPFLKGEKALSKNEMQRALVAAADTPGTVSKGKIVESVLADALKRQGFKGDTAEKARQFVHAYHDIGVHLRTLDKLHNIHYAKGAIEDRVYVPHIFEKGKGMERVAFSKSNLSKAGYAEKAQKLPYGVALALAEKEGKKNIISDPIELLGHRVQKGSINAAHGILQQSLRDTFARPEKLYNQASRGKVYTKVDKLKAQQRALESHVAGHDGRVARSRMMAGQQRATFQKSLDHAVSENKARIAHLEEQVARHSVSAKDMATHVVSEARKEGIKIKWRKTVQPRMEREGNTITLIMAKPNTKNDYLVALHELEHAVIENTSAMHPRRNFELGARTPDLSHDELTLENEAQAWHGALGKSIVPVTSRETGPIKKMFGSYGGEGLRTSETHSAVMQQLNHPAANKASLTASMNAAKREQSALQKIVSEAPHKTAYTQAVTDAGIMHAKSLSKAQSNLDKIGKALITEEPKAAKKMWEKNPKALEQGWERVESLSHPGTSASGKLHYTLPKEMKDGIANVEKAMIDPSRMRGLEAAFTKSISIWKLSVTSVNPGYRIRNSISDLWNMYISGVPMAQIPVYAAKAMLVSKQAWRAERKIKEGIALTKVEKEAMVLVRTAHGQGVMSGLFEGDVGKGINRMRTPSKNPVTGYARKATTFNANAENVGRLTHYLYRLDHGHSSYSAAEIVRGAHFDYEDLSTFEQRIMKNIAPFYTWTRKNVPYQLQAIAQRPGRVATYGKVSTTSQQMSGAKPSDVIGHALDYHPLGIRMGSGYIDPQIGLNDLYNLEHTSNELNMVNPVAQDVMTALTGRQFGNGVALTGPDAAHQAIPAPGLLSGLLQPFGLGETTQRPVNGVGKYGPGVNPWVGQIAGQIPLGSYLMSRNPIDEARKGSTPFGVDPRTLSYGFGLSYTNVDKQQQEAIAAMETAAADKAYIKHLRDQGLMAPSSWAPGNSWFDNYLKKYNKKQTQAG